MTPAEEKTEEKLFPLKTQWLVDKPARAALTHASCHILVALVSSGNSHFQFPVAEEIGTTNTVSLVALWNKLERWVIGKTEKDQSLKSRKKKRQSRFSAQAGRPTAELMKISPLVLLPTSLKHPPVDPPLKIQSFKHFQQNIKYIHSEPLISLRV